MVTVDFFFFFFYSRLSSEVNGWVGGVAARQHHQGRWGVAKGGAYPNVVKKKETHTQDTQV